MKRQPLEWEKVIANETTDKGLISKIYKQLVQLNTRKSELRVWGLPETAHFRSRSEREGPQRSPLALALFQRRKQAAGKGCVQGHTGGLLLEAFLWVAESCAGAGWGLSVKCPRGTHGLKIKVQSCGFGRDPEACEEGLLRTA